jgi:mevalonate kinase
MNLREVTMKYGRLVVFIRHDSAEIWGLRYGLTLVIGTLKIKESTGVFVHVVCALKHSIVNFPSQPSTTLT